MDHTYNRPPWWQTCFLCLLLCLWVLYSYALVELYQCLRHHESRCTEEEGELELCVRMPYILRETSTSFLEKRSVGRLNTDVVGKWACGLGDVEMLRCGVWSFLRYHCWLPTACMDRLWLEWEKPRLTAVIPLSCVGELRLPNVLPIGSCWRKCGSDIGVLVCLRPQPQPGISCQMVLV